MAPVLEAWILNQWTTREFPYPTPPPTFFFLHTHFTGDIDSFSVRVLETDTYLPGVLLSRSVVSNSLQPHGLQPARLLCLSPSPRAGVVGVGSFLESGSSDPPSTVNLWCLKNSQIRIKLILRVAGLSVYLLRFRPRPPCDLSHSLTSILCSFTSTESAVTWQVVSGRKKFSSSLLILLARPRMKLTRDRLMGGSQTEGDFPYKYKCFLQKGNSYLVFRALSVSAITPKITSLKQYAEEMCFRVANSPPL